MKIGILGGSFNPIHNGHLALAQYMITSRLVDEIWLMVSPENPLKKKNELIDEGIRLYMAKLAVKDMPCIKACDFEFSLPRPSYTWVTLNALKEKYPQYDFSLIIGADNWLVFSSWAHASDIIHNYDLFVYPRLGYDINLRSLPVSVRILNSPVYPVCSSMLREKIQHCENVEQWIPHSVYDYIRDNKLYLEEM